MQLEEYFDFLAPLDIRLKGTRVGIESVLDYYLFHEMRPEEILRHLPSLSLEQVYATILYYLRHKDAVGKYMTGINEWAERERHRQRDERPELYEKMRQLREESVARTRHFPDAVPVAG